MNKFYKDYEKAVLNEIELDEKAYLLLGMKPIDYAFLPRPLKFVRYFKTKIYFSKFFSIIFPVFWLCLMPFFFLYQLFLVCKEKWRKKNAFSFSDNVEHVLYLVYSIRAMDVFKSHDAGLKSKYYVLMPWVKVEFFEDRSVKLVSLLSCKQMFIAYVRAVQSVLMFYLLSSKKAWTLQTYMAFNWFLVYFALRDLSHVEFVCAEHYDRWAVLTDLTVTNNRVFGDNSCLLTIMQHGFLGRLTSAQTPLNLPYRLNSVSHVYVYNDISFDFFNSYVFGYDSTSLTPERHTFVPQIELTTIDSANLSSKVLFVGSPVCEEFQMLLYDSINKKLGRDVIFYYKPHPLNPSTERIKDVSWLLIEDKKHFPFVDLVISYPSTLEYEYALHGVKTVSHSIDACSDEVQFYADQVILILDKFYFGDAVE